MMKSITYYFLCSLIFLLFTSSAQAEVMLKELQGQNIPFSALKGKWVLINYWAGWCKTCVEEIPEFNRFYQQHKKEAVALFAVNFDSLPVIQQKSLIKQLHIDYPNLLNDPASELNLGDIVGVPVTFVFNPQGVLIKTLYGGQSVKSLNQVINEQKTI